LILISTKIVDKYLQTTKRTNGIWKYLSIFLLRNGRFWKKRLSLWSCNERMKKKQKKRY